MPSAHLTLREEDVVRLTLEFLHNRDLHISQLSVERETGVINGNYSDDVLFLRQLILDGQWDDVLEFIQPLEALQTFDMRKFCYIIMTHKYIELLCIKSEAGLQGNNVDNAVEEVVHVLNDLEKYAPSKEEYSNLCLLLTLPRLSDHLLYKDWNPSNARVKCFREVFPLVEPFLPGDRKTLDQATGNVANVTTAKNDRLIQLIIKGILYESCVNYCQAKATGSKESQTQEMSFSRLLDGSVGFSDSDLSLLSWLQSIPSDTFSVPFEQRTLNVDVERLERPSLETSWTEHMLVTPIKPKTFPHSAMPFTRPRSAADIMSRSLHPAFDGLASGLQGSPAHLQNPRVMALSTGDIQNPMSRSSFASFHLTGIGAKNNKLMNTSVDRLFENENDVFLSSSYAEFQQLPSIMEHASTPKSQGTPISNLPTPSTDPPRSKSKSPDNGKTTETPAVALRSTPHTEGSPTTSMRSSRRDSLAERAPGQTAANVYNAVTNNGNGTAFTIPAASNTTSETQMPSMENSYNGDLLKEYQRQKLRVQEQLTAKEKEREELIRQMKQQDNRLVDESVRTPNKTSGLNGVPRTNCPNSNGQVQQLVSNQPSTPSTTNTARPSNGSVSPAHAKLANQHYENHVPEGHYDTVKMGTAINHAAAMKRLDALFSDVKIDHQSKQKIPEIHVTIETKPNANCDVHGGQHQKYAIRRGSLGNILHVTNRRDSLGNILSQRRESIATPSAAAAAASAAAAYGPRRESMPALNFRKRDSLTIPPSPMRRNMEHPSGFPATLRSGDMSASQNSLRRDSLCIPLHETTNFPNSGSQRRGSNCSLHAGGIRKDSIGSNSLRRDSNASRRKFSTDSLDNRRNSWDPSRRNSSGSSIGWDDHSIWEKPVNRTGPGDNEVSEANGARPRFIAVTSLEDVQAVRCAEFHPAGQLYAVGSNSKTLRICAYPKLNDIRDDHQTYQPTVLFKRTKHHKGSIYCLAWSPMGDLLATGSNDKTVKLMRFNADTSNLEGQEIELSMHDGTVRDLCFIEDTSNKSSLLISGGAGDCKIYVTDCETGTPFQALSGHSGHVLSLYNWGGAIFASGSQDKTIRFWDLRTRGCVNVVTPSTVPGSRGSGVASLCVETSGRLLVSGHEDGCCALFDIRGNRPVQCFKPHASDIRSTRFSPSAYYLLTAGYDNKLVLTDLQGDLTMALPSVVVAQHQDKVISGRWHPTEFSFISTSADKTATLWALPPV